MSTSSFDFVLLVLAGAAVFPFLPGRAAKLGVLSFCNLTFLASQMTGVLGWMVLAVFLVSGYGFGLILRARPNKGVFAAYLVLLVAAFVVLKRYVFLGWFLPERFLSHGVAVVGLSYMLFRQIHFVVDAMQEQIPRVTLTAYVNYQLNLFGLVAGPIQRFQDFEAYWSQPQPFLADRHEVLKTYLRLFWGCIKVAGLGAACFFAYQKFFGRLVVADQGLPAGRLDKVIWFFAVLYLYPTYMYLNFSGYCDIVIAAAALIGLRMPENFDRPYLSRNMLDFWTRWHRTLGFWIRDYLFMPMYKAIAERNARIAPSVAFFCYFVAFVLAGIWHGSTTNFAVFGLLQGSGASAAKLWEMFIVRRWGRSGLKTYLNSGPARVVAIVATLHFVAVALLFFPTTLDRCMVPIRVLLSALKPG